MFFSTLQMRKWRHQNYPRPCSRSKKLPRLRARMQTQASPSNRVSDHFSTPSLAGRLGTVSGPTLVLLQDWVLSRGLCHLSCTIGFQGTGDVGVSRCHGLYNTHPSPAGISCSEQQLLKDTCQNPREALGEAAVYSCRR